MLRFRFALIILFITTVSNIAPAQEKITAEEILRFLPEANYTGIVHYDFAAGRSEPAWPLFNHFVTTRSAIIGSQPSYRSNPLPEEFHGREYALTVARTYAVSKTEMVLAQPKKKGDILRAARKKFPNAAGARPLGEPDADGMQRYEVSIFSGDSLTIIRAHDSNAIIAEAIAKGYFEKSGSQLDGRSVYQFENKDRRGLNQSHFALNTGSGEILIARRLDTLQLMLNADNGETSIFDYPDHSDLLSVMSDLGQHFEIQIPPDLWEKQIQRLREAGKADENQINQIKASREQTHRYRVSNYDISGELRNDLILLYRSEAAATAAESRMKMRFSMIDKNPQLSEHERKLTVEMKKSLVANRNGKRLVVSMSLSRELVRAELNRIRELKEERKENTGKEQ